MHYASTMARHLRVEYVGAIYHVTVRGNAQQDIFCDDGDRRLLYARIECNFGDASLLLTLFSHLFHQLAQAQETLPLGNYRDTICVDFRVGADQFEDHAQARSWIGGFRFG